MSQAKEDAPMMELSYLLGRICPTPIRASSAKQSGMTPSRQRMKYEKKVTSSNDWMLMKDVLVPIENARRAKIT
jgi:hypothetical protein